MGEHDTIRILDLIGEKFAEIFQIRFAFSRVNDGAKRVKLGIFEPCVGNRFDHVAKFSHARRFDHDTIGRIFRRDLF